MGIRFGLELSSGTKLGSTAGQWGHIRAGSGVLWVVRQAGVIDVVVEQERLGSGDEGSGGTVLTVERTSGKTITSSPSLSSSSSSSAPVAVALPFPRSLDLSPSSSADKATDPASPWRSSCSSFKRKDCVREDRLEVGSSPQTERMIAFSQQWRIAPNHGWLYD